MGTVNLTWDEPVDTTGLSYILKRDGVILGTYAPGTSSASDTTVVNGASYAYTLETENSSGNIGTASVNISIPAIAPVLGTIPDQTSYQDTSFSLNLNTYVTSDGGDPNITWTVTTGVLPTGLSLDIVTGIVSGTPTTIEIQAVGYTATNSAGASNVSSHSIDVQVNSGLGPLDVDASNWVRGSTSGLLDGYYTNFDIDSLQFTWPETVPTFAIGSGTEYYVDPVSGSDASDGLTTGTAFATIAHASSLASTAGDTINLMAGTFIESSGVDIRDGVIASFVSTAPGVEGNPITFRANPGDEGLVIIDGETVRAGWHSGTHSYVQVYGLRFENCMFQGAGGWDCVNADYSSQVLAKGIRFENNLIKNVYGRVGYNDAPIRYSRWEDSIIYNNRFDIGVGANQVHGIHCYGAVNVLIRNNEMIGATTNGFYPKDHFVTDFVNRFPMLMAEVRNNYFESNTGLATGHGMLLGIRGGGTGETGYHSIHHNIVRNKGSSSSDYAGIAIEMSGAAEKSFKTDIYNNIIDGNSSINGLRITGLVHTNINGNIVLNVGTGIVTSGSDIGVDRMARITASDNNVLSPGGSIGYTGQYMSNANSYPQPITNWQQADITADIALMVQPDLNSLGGVAEVDLFTDALNRDYSHATNSPAIGLMPDGTNAGTYQIGDEVIGTLPTYSAGA